jgi:hypothetical protein
MIEAKIAIESNSFTYLLDAMWSKDQPEGDDADEKIALIRLFMYRSDVFYITPTVKEEVSEIRDFSNLQDHQSLSGAHLGITEDKSQTEVEELAKFYQRFHSKKRRFNDCKIVAEAELDNCSFLLSYDKDLVKNLSGNTKSIKVEFPSKFWESLAIPRGAEFKWSPAQTNPLAKQSWWKW